MTYSQPHPTQSLSWIMLHLVRIKFSNQLEIIPHLIAYQTRPNPLEVTEAGSPNIIWKLHPLTFSLFNFRTQQISTNLSEYKSASCIRCHFWNNPHKRSIKTYSRCSSKTQLRYMDRKSSHSVAPSIYKFRSLDHTQVYKHFEVAMQVCIYCTTFK